MQEIHTPVSYTHLCGCCRLAERADKEVDVSGAAGLLGATESLPCLLYTSGQGMYLLHIPLAESAECENATVR